MKIPNYIELEKYNLNVSQFYVSSKCENETATTEELENTLLKIKEILISLNENPEYVYINKKKENWLFVRRYKKKSLRLCYIKSK